MASKHPGILGAEALAPRHLFDGNVHYEIPPFQRPCAWNEEDQWAPLSPDIARVAESVPAVLGTDTPIAAPHHFLGAVRLRRCGKRCATTREGVARGTRRDVWRPTARLTAGVVMGPHEEE